MATQLDESAIADRINADSLRDILEKYTHNDVEICNYTIEDGAPKGQNFMSTVMRAKVTYKLHDDEQKTISMILKTGLVDSELAENSEYVFKIERDVYGPIMRQIRILLTSYGDCSVFGPKLIHDDTNLLVLEDLSEKGYKQPDRKQRLDMSHCKLLIRKLAKFHAATAVLGRKNPELFKLHTTSAFLDVANQLRLYYLNSIAECISLAKTTTELKQYENFLRTFGENVIERECAVFSQDNEEFPVLNHGDLWLNNVLWKYDSEGNVEDVLLIDYQECFYGSPGIDLNHFLYTSANNDVQSTGFEELIQIYVDELQSALLLFKYDATIPTLESILHEMKKKLDHAVVVTTCIVPALIIERTELATPENMLDDSEQARQARREVFTNPKFVEILKILLPKLAADQ
ncbi:uncharacterized protein LOC129777007 [Toxorhynchites rutilus septentrionalis]|uniref:uncharacterized protein LOC129777007 n=1 Tax=Toxorhynchites rutilus septentrionalis TaxID=329112 RepID=UPI00247AFE0B|nr:uncharacterized protein LOC129777007 [Toxorhynchites rutilus septentrionalis]